MSLERLRELLVANNFKAALNLVKSDPRIVFQRGIRSETALHIVAASMGKLQYPLTTAMADECRDLINELKTQRADFNAIDLKGNTPLMIACDHLHFSVVEQLTAMTDVNYQNYAKQTAIELLDAARQKAVADIKHRVNLLHNTMKELKGDHQVIANIRIRTLSALTLLKSKDEYLSQQYGMQRLQLQRRQFQQKNGPSHFGVSSSGIMRLAELKVDRKAPKAVLVKSQQPRVLLPAPLDRMRLFAETNNAHFASQKAKQGLLEARAYLKKCL